MHELSIAQNIVSIASREAAAHGANHVVSVELTLGALAGVEPDSLSFCFPVVARDTSCEGAELRITIVPAVGRCSGCGATTEIRDLMSPCSRCAAWPLAIEGGREMTLHSVEVR